MTFEREGLLDRREALLECVAFNPRSRQDDVIHHIRGLETHRSWTTSKRNVARVWTEHDMGHASFVPTQHARKKALEVLAHLHYSVFGITAIAVLQGL